MADLFDPARGTWMPTCRNYAAMRSSAQKLRGGVVRVYRRHAAQPRAGRRHYPRPESRIHAYANGKYDSALALYDGITARAKRLRQGSGDVVGLVYQTLGQNEAALEKFRFGWNIIRYPIIPISALWRF